MREFRVGDRVRYCFGLTNVTGVIDRLNEQGALVILDGSGHALWASLSSLTLVEP